MGTENIPSATDGNIIPASHNNTIKAALAEAVVPRNTSGVPTDDAGGLGTSVYRWGASFIKKITLGVSANLVTFEELSSAFLMKFNGVTGLRVTAAGLDASTVEDGTLAFAAFESTEAPSLRVSNVFDVAGSFQWTVPDNVHEVLVLLCGGGGGGGGGGGCAAAHANGGGGGGGGAGSIPVMYPLKTTPGEILDIVIGAGGGGGAGGQSSPLEDGSDGTSGGVTSVTGDWGVLSVDGGEKGYSGKKAPSGLAGGGGTGGLNPVLRRGLFTHGGSGVQGNNVTANGVSGYASFPYAASGGAGGTKTNKSNGGGGGGGRDNGGAAANAGGGNATVGGNGGGGAGGHGGQFSTNETGETGAAGGPGYVEFIYAGPA